MSASERSQQSLIRPPWQFQPGQSGNPGGRKAAVDLPALCREHGPRGVEVCAALMEDPDPRIRLAAVIALWDRGFGKPSQTVTDATTGEPVTFLHLVAMRAFSDELNAQRVVDGNVVSRETTTDNTTQSQPRNLMEPATE
jgi:hypothetical protein